MSCNATFRPVSPHLNEPSMTMEGALHTKNANGSLATDAGYTPASATNFFLSLVAVTV